MADFCWDCAAHHFGPEYAERNDMRGLCEEGHVAGVLCEGCGPIWVDPKGRRVCGQEVEE